MTTPAAALVPVTEKREAERFVCPHSPLLQAVVRPNFAPVTVIVEDVSTKGVGLFCDEPIEPGVRVAVLWMCGPQRTWRTVRARVARLTPGKHDGWIVGCVFDEQLQVGDVVALVRNEGKPDAAAGDDYHDSAHTESGSLRTTGKKPMDRRSAIRKPTRVNIRLQCSRRSLSTGPNLATRLVDISQGGVQMVAKVALLLREEVEIVLYGYGIHTPIRRMGEVHWAVPVEGGGCCAGVQFEKVLSRLDVQALTNPQPAHPGCNEWSPGRGGVA